jgi:hypothetical protein
MLGVFGKNEGEVVGWVDHFDVEIAVATWSVGGVGGVVPHYVAEIEQNSKPPRADLKADLQLEELPVWFEAFLETVERGSLEAEVVTHQMIHQPRWSIAPGVGVVVHIADDATPAVEAANRFVFADGIRGAVGKVIAGGTSHRSHLRVAVAFDVASDPIHRSYGVVVDQQH